MIKQMTTMKISTNREKEQQYDVPLLPCNISFSSWQKGGIDSWHWHWHRDLELMYVESGCVQVGCAGKQALLREGDGLFINSRVLHHYQRSGDEACTMYYIIFNPDFITGGAGTIFQQKYIHPLIIDEAFPCQFLRRQNLKDAHILQKIRAALQNAGEAKPGYEYDVRYNLAKVLLQLQLTYQPKADKPRHHDPRIERLQDMLQFLQEHFSQKISLEQIAASAGISTREAQRCFQAIVRMTPMEYLHNYRLHLAEEMLIDSNESILEIGMNCGFANPSHFIKSFREYRGCTPRVFRKNNILSPDKRQ